MKLSVIIPFYADESPEGRHRRRLWNYIKPMWADLLGAGVVHEVIVAADPLINMPTSFENVMAGGLLSGDPLRLHQYAVEAHQWSTARALHAAWPRVTGDAAVAFGADHLPDTDVLIRAQSLLHVQPWTFLYKDVIYASEASTLGVLDNNGHPDDLDFAARSGCCKGMWAWRREVWEETGGVDPRFVGWGYGDDAWNDVLESVYGPSPTPPGDDLRELWHPAAYRDATAANPNQQLYAKEYLPHRGDREYMLGMQSRWQRG